ncbi:MAG: nucleoside phosphorylase [Bacteroidaceae bacterium]|nr:nucleoside phosphorylase [Bacteroidaceae bacterium]
MPNTIPPSELIINPDGSVFHLHVTPHQIADKVIIVGDPARVETVASFFETIECRIVNREFRTITGSYQGKRISVVSSGIGCDNIDIVINELDALVNIDFETRQIKSELKNIDIVRIGTCGGLQENCPVGTYLVSETSIGFDGLLNFYANRDKVCDQALETTFVQHMGWSTKICQPHPYVIHADPSLTNQIALNDMLRGITISCGGFYGPQGRVLRLPLADADQNEKIRSFNHHGAKITNFEMESSAIAGLAALLGHRATTVCMVIANRFSHQANTNYHSSIENLIKTVLDRI